MKCAIILVLLGLALAGCQGGDRGTGEDTMEKIRLTATDEGPFKYFQLAAATGPGVAGEILLNGQSIHSFTAEGSQVSSNKAQDIIKDGDNTITLKVTDIADKTERAVMTESVITIGIHALNEQAFPNDDNKVISIDWNPNEARSTETLTYVFSLKRQ